MERRTFLSVVGGGSIGTGTVIAGCTEVTEPSGESDGGNDNNTGDDNGSTDVDGDAGETSEPEFEIRDHDFPDRVTVGESVQLSFTVANVGDTDGVYEDRLIITPDGPNLNSIDVEFEIAAGETARWSETVEFDHAGTVLFRIDSVGPTETVVEPASTAPRIQMVNLIEKWDTFGDVVDNAIDVASVDDDFITIGTRYEYWHEDDTHHVFREVEIREAGGGLVAVEQNESERLTDDQWWEEWEFADPISTARMSPGAYVAEVRIRDERTGAVSDPERTNFRIE